MKPADLAVYFKKKIAKPINFDIGIRNGSTCVEQHYFAIETTAVEEDADGDFMLHMMVALRHSMSCYSECQPLKGKGAKHCGEVKIPIHDGDSVEDVLEMAIADAAFGKSSLHVETTRRKDRLKDAYEKLDARFEKADEVAPRGP